LNIGSCNFSFLDYNIYDSLIRFLWTKIKIFFIHDGYVYVLNIFSHFFYKISITLFRTSNRAVLKTTYYIKIIVASHLVRPFPRVVRYLHIRHEEESSMMHISKILGIWYITLIFTLNYIWSIVTVIMFVFSARLIGYYCFLFLNRKQDIIVHKTYRIAWIKLYNMLCTWIIWMYSME